MGQQQMTAGSAAVATAALLTGATVWGLIWYPYRIVEQAGVSGTAATVATYAIALIAGLLAMRHSLHGLRFSWWLPVIALAAGGCNLGYVLAVLHGEVMRVLLLFYLSPLWTVLLSRLLLDERLRPAGAVVIGCSVLGAMVMLWRPELGIPWPRNPAEWLGLGAGFCFALQNVLIRRTPQLSIELKTLTVFAGVIVLGLLLIPFEPMPDLSRLEGVHWVTLLVLGLLLLLVNLVVQVGLTALAANRAIVIMLFELVVAAASAWWLAGESTGPAEWLGGALIVVASVFAGKLEEKPKT